MIPPALVYQADTRWHHLALGHGPSTIGRSGCVLTSLVIAARQLATRAGLTPAQANLQLLVARCFVDDRLLVDRAASTLGLAIKTRESTAVGDSADKHAAAVRASVSCGVALVRVDHTGDSVGDHTVVAIGISDDGVNAVILDPAAGLVTLDLATCTCVAWWGRTHLVHYSVTAVQPVVSITQ